MWKQFSPASNSGFTIIELLVASTLSLLVLALVLSTSLTNKLVYQQDVVRTRINQNLRSAIDIIGMNMRQAGEALPSFFPAIEVVNGTGGGSDQLILRRNLYENEILNICQDLTAGTSTANIRFAYQTSEIACAYSSELVAYLNTWLAYRTQQGGQAKAYVYNRSAKVGELFTFDDGTDTGTELFIHRTAGNWAYDYPGDGLSAAMYLLEEYHFLLENGVLKLIQNGDNVNTLNIVDGITDFQVAIHMQDDTTQYAFSANDLWTSIKSLEITLAGADMYAGKLISSSITDRLFPRNVLSH